MKKNMLLILFCILGINMEIVGMSEAESAEWQQIESKYNEVNQRAEAILIQAQPTIDDVTRLLMRVPPQLLVDNPTFVAKYAEVSKRKNDLSTVQKNLSDIQYKMTQFKSKLSKAKVTPPDRLKEFLDAIPTLKDRVKIVKDDVEKKLETLDQIKQRGSQLTSIPTVEKKEVWEKEPKVQVKPLIDIDKANVLIDTFKVTHSDLDDARLKQKIFLASMPSLKKQTYDPKEATVKIDPRMESNRTEALAIIDEYIRTHANEDVSPLEEVKAILKTYGFKYKSEETLSQIRKEKRKIQKEEKEIQREP